MTNVMINKTFAKIICIFAVIGTIGVIVWANLYSAPYRAVENFFASLESGDEWAFGKVSDGVLDLDYAYELVSRESGFYDDDEKPDFKVKLLERERDADGFWITVEVTAYTDEESKESEFLLNVKPDRFGAYRIMSQSQDVEEGCIRYISYSYFY
jgi:hypothetical protein